MSSTAILRSIARGPSASLLRAARPVATTSRAAAFPAARTFSITVARRSDAHEETFEEFTARYGSSLVFPPRIVTSTADAGPIMATC